MSRVVLPVKAKNDRQNIDKYNKKQSGALIITNDEQEYPADSDDELNVSKLFGQMHLLTIANIKHSNRCAWVISNDQVNIN